MFSFSDSVYVRRSGIMILVGCVILAASAAQAGDINWNAPQDTTDVLDLLLTGGNVHYALNGGTRTVTVGGVSFLASDYVNLPTGVGFHATGDSSVNTPQVGTLDDVYAGGAMPSTGNASYDQLIGSLAFSKGDPDGIVTGTMRFGGLTSGEEYRVQVWYNDQRDDYDGRTMRYGDGQGHTVDLAGGDPASGVQSNAYGRYAIGSFTASGASQDLTMESLGFGNVHFNAVLVQDASPSSPPPPLPRKNTPGWTIDSQEEWAEAYHSGSFHIDGGQVNPTAAAATFESRMQTFTEKQRFTSVTFKQNARWGAGEWKANDGSIVQPSNGDAPVFVSPAEGDYWFLNADGGGQNYKAYHSTDMKNWTNHGDVTGANWVTSAEYKDGVFYVYYDEANDEDPHLVTFTDLSDADTRTNHGEVFDDPTWGSDMAIFRDLDGTFHIIHEDWSKIKASNHSWDSQVAGHTTSPDGINGWNDNIQADLFDESGSPTGAADVNYNHPYIGTISYTPHTNEDAWGDYEMLRVGDMYYLFCDDHPDGENIGLGYWYSDDIDGPFTYGGKIIDNVHPDPTAGFAEGQFFLFTQGEDLISHGPWVDAVVVQVGVDTDGDGEADVWTEWQDVSETYGRIDGFAKAFSVDPALLDLSDLPEGYGIQFRFQTSDMAAVMDSVTIESVPEPASLALLGLGSVLMLSRRKARA